MLLWQRIVWHKRYSFLSKIFFFSAVSHSALLFVMLFFYKGENFTQTLNLDAHDMTVMFLPFQKTVTAQLSGSQNRSPSSLKVVSSQRSAKKSGSKKQKAEPKTAFTDKKEGGKKEKEKGKKKDEQKSLQKNDVQEKKPEVEKVEKPQEEKQQEEKQQNIEIPVETIDLSDEDVVYAGQQDFNALELRQELLSEIEQAWHPPTGISLGKLCKVRVLIGWEGAIEELVFEEPSNIVAFDTSVRHALLTMKFPKSSYGKELILPFH